MASTELKRVEIRAADYDFLLPLDHGRRIVAFKNWGDKLFYAEMSCFDLSGRLIRSADLVSQVKRTQVGQCGPNEFVVCQYPHYPALSVYDSALRRLRYIRRKELTICSYNFSAICCNSKFLFGLWDTNEAKDYYYESDSDEDDGDNDDYNLDSDEKEDQYSSLRVQACHLDTLTEAFSLRVPSKNTIERIMVDEHHMVAMSRLEVSGPEFRQWFMSIFDLQASAKTKDNKTVRKFHLVESHIDLTIEPLLLSNVFLFDGWMVVPLKDANEMVWFDKSGKRSETSTVLDTSNLQAIYASGSSLLFAVGKDKLLLKS